MKQLITVLIIVCAIAIPAMASFDFTAINGANEFMSRQDYFRSGPGDFRAWPTSGFNHRGGSSRSWIDYNSELPFSAYSMPESIRFGYRGYADRDDSRAQTIIVTQLDWNEGMETNGNSWDCWHESRPQASVVPVPGSIILGTIGVAIIGYLRKRKTI